MLNIKINKDGVFLKQNGEVVRIEDKTVDELALYLNNYICNKDNEKFNVYADICGGTGDKTIILEDKK